MTDEIQSLGNHVMGTPAKFYKGQKWTPLHHFTASSSILQIRMEKLVPFPSFASPVLRRFKCSYCPYSSDVSTNLKHHILRHTGEKNHKCETCGSRFTLKHHLKKHMQLHLL